MTNVAFKLHDSGFSREQIDALTEFTTNTVATKEDIADLRGEMNTRFLEMNGKIDAQGERLESKIDAQGEKLEGEIKTQVAHLGGRITLLSWMLGILIASVLTLIFNTLSVTS